ncbi:hypothetical protein [Clostridium sp.]|uniref:hypothetical protein n=1 Tax=Clostridium sp. TaxID=1506 RepID=UPI003F348AC8
MSNIISISGIDGSGKSTQIDLLRQYICSKFNLSSCSVYDFNPKLSYDDLSDLDSILYRISEYDVILLRPYMKSKRNIELQKDILQNNFFKNDEKIEELAKVKLEDINNWFDRVILKLIHKNKIILFDRYVYDEICYRALYNKSLEDFIYLYNHIPKPNISFYIDENIQILKERNKLRNDGETVLFKETVKLVELRDNFRKISQLEDIKTIQENLLLDEIFKIISEDVYKYLKEKGFLK